MSTLKHLALALKAYPAPSARSALGRAMRRMSREELARLRTADAREILRVLSPEAYRRARLVIDDMHDLGIERGSVNALYAFRAVFDAIEELDATDAFGFAVQCAQARAGDHPCPNALRWSLEFDQEGLCISGPAWRFWGERSDEAIRAAREGFYSYVMYSAGLGDEPKLPDSIAPEQCEPNDPIAPGFPEALRDLVDNLDEEGDEDGQINTLRDIADVEKSGAFAIVDESLWSSLSDELRELAKQYDIEVGARLSALIDVALGCPDCWRKADRVRESLIAALLAWSKEEQCTH